MKYKKYVGFTFFIFFISIMINSIAIMRQKYSNAEAIDIIIQCQDLEKEKKYQEAFDKLQYIYKNYDELIKSNDKFETLLNLYNYKLGLLVNIKDIPEKKIINTKYISQFYHYDDFSLAGEFTLLQKMIIHYNNKEYKECEETYNIKKMQKLPHFIASIYKAKSMLAQNKKIEAKEFLSHVFLYNHDYSNGHFSEIIKNLLFSID